MRITRIHLVNFRNYADTVIEFGPDFNFIVGGNGKGKTGLLEAIAFLISGRSFSIRTMSSAGTCPSTTYPSTSAVWHADSSFVTP